MEPRGGEKGTDCKILKKVNSVNQTFHDIEDNGGTSLASATKHFGADCN
jgi:hypothetical protein